MSVIGCVIHEKDGSETLWDAIGTLNVKTNLLMLDTTITQFGDVVEYVSHKTKEQAVAFHASVASCIHWPIQKNFTVH